MPLRSKVGIIRLVVEIDGSMSWRNWSLYYSGGLIILTFMSNRQ